MKSAKNALITSVITMLVCVAMLAGTTFAWFTDTASTGVNKIQAGILDVQLLNDDGSEELGAEPLKWEKASAGAGETVLWEPGATYNLEGFRIKNNGDLALKYKVQINGIVGDAELLQVIDFTVTVEGQDPLDPHTPGTTVATPADLHNFEGMLAPGHMTGEITITGKMRESAGNEYQGKVIDGITITVIATQDDIEHDSESNQYDAGAEYPVSAVANVNVDPSTNATTVATTMQSNNVVTVGGTSVPQVQATVPAGAAVAQNVTQLEVIVNEVDTPANFTVQTDTMIRTLDVHVSGLADTNTEPITVTVYYGARLANFTLYHDGQDMTRVNTAADVDADQEYYYDPTTGFLTFMSVTFSPFTATYGEGLWSAYAATAYATPVDDTNKVVTIASAKELALFANEINSGAKNYGGYTVQITADIDLGKHVWTPITMTNGVENNITLDGGDHTITGLTVVDYVKGDNIGGVRAYSGLFCQFGGTAKDLTLENSTIVGHRTGVFAGATNKDVTLENVRVRNATIYAYQKNGGLIGYVRSTGNVGTSTVEITGCTVDNVLFQTYDSAGSAAPWQCGGIWGYSDVLLIATVTNNTVSNITILDDPSEAYLQEKGNNLQLASHPFIGNVVSFNNMGAKATAADYGYYSVTLANNKIEGTNTGFVTGNGAHEYIGSFYKNSYYSSNVFRPTTKVVVDGVEITVESAVQVKGVAGFENKKYLTLKDAYNAIRPTIAALAGLDQATATKEQFDAVFKEIASGSASDSMSAKITFEIYGKQTIHDSLVFSFGRAAAYYNPERWLSNFEIVGMNAGAELVFENDITLPRNWWTYEADPITITFKNIALTEKTGGQISIRQAYAYAINVNMEKCTVNGNVYLYHNDKLNMNVTGTTFHSQGDSYALMLQGDHPGKVVIENCTFNEYSRGVNFQRNDTEFTLEGCTFKSTRAATDRGVIQLTDGKTFVVTGNTIDVNAGNAIWFHEKATNADVTYTITNNNIRAAYLANDDTSFGADARIIAGDGNTFGNTDTLHCMKKEETEAKPSRITKITGGNATNS